MRVVPAGPGFAAVCPGCQWGHDGKQWFSNREAAEGAAKGHSYACDGWRETPVEQGETAPERETIGAQVKTAPAVRKHRDSGASPTNEESTDG